MSVINIMYIWCVHKNCFTTSGPDQRQTVQTIMSLLNRVAVSSGPHLSYNFPKYSSGDFLVYICLTSFTVYTMGKNCRDSADCLEPMSRCVDSGNSEMGKHCLCPPLYEYVEDNRACEESTYVMTSAFMCNFSEVG